MMFGMTDHRNDDNGERTHDALIEPGDRALNTAQVCELIGIKPITAAQWRARGEGPRWVRVGRRHIRYRRRDVEEWIAARTVGKRA